MTIEIDPDYKMDVRVVNYRDPQSAVASLVQQPEHKITGQALANAYMADYRSMKRKDHSDV